MRKCRITIPEYTWKLGKSDQDVANTFLRGLPFTYQVHVLNQKPITSTEYVEAA